MKAFQAWLAATPLGTALKAFIAIVLTLAVSDFAAHGSIDFGAWQTWVIAGLVSAAWVAVVGGDGPRLHQRAGVPGGDPRVRHGHHPGRDEQP